MARVAARNRWTWTRGAGNGTHTGRRGTLLAAGRRRSSAAMVAVLSLVMVVLGAQSARAATFDGGVLTIGTTTTLTSSAYGEVWTYTAAVPAGKRFTLTVGDSAAPIGANIVASVSGRTIGSLRTGNNRTGDIRVFDVDPASTDRTLALSVQALGKGELPFTPALLDDPAGQVLVWATPTAASISTAGQKVTFTFQGVAGHRLGVTLSGSTFPVGNQPTVKATIQAQGQAALPLRVTGPTVPGLLMDEAVPYTLVVDGVGAATGTITVRIDDVADLTTPVSSGATQTADLATVWTQVGQPYQNVVGGHLRVEVLSSTLRHADGTPGRATITSLEVLEGSGYQFHDPIGTVADQPVTFEPDSVMADSGPRTLEIVPDGTTTGTLSYRVTIVDAVEGGTLAYDHPTTVTIPTAHAAVLFSAHVAAGDRVTIAAMNPSLTAAAGTDAPQLSIAPIGYHLTSISDRTLLVGAGSASYELYGEDSTDADIPLVVQPIGTTTGSVTLLLHKVTTVATPLVPGQAVTAGAGIGDTLTFTTPGGADVAPVVKISSAVKGVDGQAQVVDLDVLQDGSNVDKIWSVSNNAVTAVLSRGIDPTKPWSLGVVWPTFVGSYGTVTVELVTPHVRTRTIRSGAATTISLDRPGDAAKLVLPVAAGQRIAWRSTPTSGAKVRVRLADASGAQQGPWDEYWYNEVDGPASAGRVTFTVENLSTTGGQVTFSAWAVSDPVIPVSGTRTIRWDVAQNPKLTFRGIAGTRAILDVSAAAWSYGGGATPGPAPRGASFTAAPVLIAPDGSTTTLEGISAGMSSWLEVPGVLPATGTYTIRLDPDLDAAGRITAQLRQPVDQQRKAVLGTPVQVDTRSPGQNSVLTVTVPDGTRLNWSVHDSRYADASIRLETSDGTVIGGATMPPPTGSAPGSGTGFLQADPLPAGTYRVVVDPQGHTTGSAQITLTAGT